MKTKSSIQLLLAGLLVLPLAAVGAPLVTPNLAGSTEYEGWEGLTATNYPTYPGWPGSALWPAPIDSNITGSAGNAGFDKVSGGGYPASQSIYNFTVPGTYEIAKSSAIFGLETVVVQLDLGEGNSFFTATPVLNYNGGTQALAPTFSEQGAGPTAFTNPQTGDPGTTTLFGYQWDLSSVSSITEYAIEWTTDAHVTTYNLRLDSSDTYSGNAITAVPEPATSGLALALAVLGLAAVRRPRLSRR